jgi:hypothetical protein
MEEEYTGEMFFFLLGIASFLIKIHLRKGNYQLMDEESTGGITSSLMVIETGKIKMRVNLIKINMIWPYYKLHILQ